MTDNTPYLLELTERVLEYLAKRDRSNRQRIISKLEWLAEHAADYRHYAMKGRWKGAFRIRIGDYRVVYRIDDKARLIVVALVGNRRDVYDR